MHLPKRASIDSKVLHAFVASVVLGTGLGVLLEAKAATFVNDVNFSTTGQSLWGPGVSPVAQANFDRLLINRTFNNFSFGRIQTTNIPNPGRVAYDAAYESCRAIGFSDSDCINGRQLSGLGQRPSNIFLRPGYDLLLGACTLLGFSESTCVNGASTPGLGAAPPATIAVQNGAAVNGNAALQFGFRGNAGVSSGNVAATYNTQLLVDLLAPDEIKAGDLFTIATREVGTGQSSLKTEFSELQARLSAFGRVAANAALEARVLSQGGSISIFNFDTGNFSQELIGATIDPGNGSVTARLGGAASTFPLTAGTVVNIGPSIAGGAVVIPYGDVVAYIPQLDTPENVANGRRVVNTRLPGTRNATDPTIFFGGGSGNDPTDFLKADVDLDGLTTLFGLPPAGIQASLPLPRIGAFAGGLVATAEANILDADVGAFLGLGQTLSFNVEDIFANFEFDKPTLVETFIGSNTFEQVTSKRIRIGEVLNARLPEGGLDVKTTYAIQNLFTNETDLLLSPAFSLSLLELRLVGFAFSQLGLDGTYALFKDTFPLGDPFSVASVSDRSFSLGGFQSVSGSNFFIADASNPIDPTNSSAVPEPSTMLGLLLFGAGSLGLKNRKKVA